jgi:MFS family permease
MLTDMSSEMLYPIVPLFLTSVLGAPVTAVGFIEGLAESTASLVKVWSGWWSDRLGRRRVWVFTGYTISALTRPLLALASGWGLVLTARVLDRFGKGVRTAPRDALIADSTPLEIRGRAFGVHRSMDQVGAVIGPLLGLLLLGALHADYRTLFLIAFIPASVSAGLVLLAREAQTTAPASRPLLRFRDASPQFRRFLLAVAVFGIGNSADAFLILRARQMGFSTEGAVALFTVFNAVYVVTAYPAGVLADRMSKHGLFAAGLLVFACAYAGFGAVAERRWLWALFAVYGIYMGLTDGVARALVVELVPMDARATALGVHSAVVGFVALPASVIAGLLWDRVSPAAPFLFGALMAGIGALMMGQAKPPAPPV